MPPEGVVLTVPPSGSSAPVGTKLILKVAFQGNNFPSPLTYGAIKFWYANTNLAASMVQDATKKVWVCRTPVGCMWRSEDPVDVPASYSKTIWIKLAASTEWAQFLGTYSWGEANLSRPVRG